MRVGEAISNSKIVTCGVPQGGILSAILFLLYINDMPLISNTAQFTLFADDTTMACSGSSYPELIASVNHHLSLLYNWTVNNKLSLNTNKTSAILFTNRLSDVAVPLIISVNNTPVLCEKYLKFLGIYIDIKLDFSEHISYLCNKLSKTAGVCLD